MFTNNLYNLMLQAVEEHKSLWRIKDEYQKDAKKSKESALFWKALVKDKEAHIKTLKELLRTELNK